MFKLKPIFSELISDNSCRNSLECNLSEFEFAQPLEEIEERISESFLAIDTFGGINAGGSGSGGSSSGSGTGSGGY